MSEIRAPEIERLTKMLEYKDILSHGWEHYANQLGYTIDQIREYSTFRFPVMTSVLNYLRNCKPSTTLSSIQKICRDEEHNIGVTEIENMITEIYAAREVKTVISKLSNIHLK